MQESGTSVLRTKEFAARTTLDPIEQEPMMLDLNNILLPKIKLISTFVRSNSTVLITYKVV